MRILTSGEESLSRFVIGAGSQGPSNRRVYLSFNILSGDEMCTPNITVLDAGDTALNRNVRHACPLMTIRWSGMKYGSEENISRATWTPGKKWVTNKSGAHRIRAIGSQQLRDFFNAATHEMRVQICVHVLMVWKRTPYISVQCVLVFNSCPLLTDGKAHPLTAWPNSRTTPEGKCTYMINCIWWVAEWPHGCAYIHLKWWNRLS